MPNTKMLIKIVLGLGFWSFLIIGLMKLQGHFSFAGVRQNALVPVSRPVTKQNHSKPVGTTTPATTERVYPNDVLIDTRPVMDDDAVVRKLDSQLPSLPIAFWRKTMNSALEKSSTCAKYPSIYDIQFNNIYWQTLQTSNGTFQLFGAYYDIRKLSKIGPAVRILGMIDRIKPTVKTFCQFWYDNRREPVIVETFEYTYIWNKHWGNYDQGIYGPHLISCKIPIEFQKLVPATVSIVEKECDMAHNNLRVIYNRPPDDKKKRFAVCVKGLEYLYNDMSARLVEWIEMLRILGAEKIFLYDLHIHPNMSRVLKHYEQEGFVKVTPLTLAGDKPNLPGLTHMYVYNRVTHARQSEIIPYDDCLYKNMYTYDFLALLDIDEVIMPKNDMTWPELMQRVLTKSKLPDKEFDSYDFRNVYFLHEKNALYDDIPKYLGMLQHVNRAQNYTPPGDSIKSFHDTERVLSLHNHFPMLCLDGWCDSYSVDTGDADLHHYCSLGKDCEKYRENSVKDTTIWKYKDELIRRSERKLDQLGFYRRP